jgi:hypothetical protein
VRARSPHRRIVVHEVKPLSWILSHEGLHGRGGVLRASSQLLAGRAPAEGNRWGELKLILEETRAAGQTQERPRRR